MRRQDRYLGPYAVNGSITPSVANCVGQRAAGGGDGRVRRGRADQVTDVELLMSASYDRAHSATAG